MKVWIVVEGPDMAYYGDAEIHGVTSSRESAEDLLRSIFPDWMGEDFDPIRIEEWEVK